MISDQFPKAERQDDFHEVSYFEVVFEDGSVRDEKDLNWSDISQEMIVDYKEKQKTVFVSIPKIKKIKVTHKDLSVELDIPDNCQVYQAIRSNATLVPGQPTVHSTIGRVIGLIKDNRVVEERFINIPEKVVLGFKE
jgi:hypothetical protein